ncbi:Protein TONSOKU [Linum perenne]
MAKGDGKLSAAKRAYKTSQAEGNRQEEARWANVIGDILKNRGEYVEALRWLRKDYDISVRYLPEKDLLATCQSIGELYLRLENFSDALFYQKRHLEIANSANDLAEKQRASTQLGRSYYEMFLRSEDDYDAARNAKKYFNLAMDLAEALKRNPSNSNSSFVKEYIDSHNNIGMLDIELDNLEGAKALLAKGLEICDEEELHENDDARSRLHHNLGIVYMELRKWNKAREHIEKDILICQAIGQCQGEAKGFINLGELHNRVQKYEDAILCYQRGLQLAKSMEDEDALVKQIEQNVVTVREATQVMVEIKAEEQNLKKLTRDMVAVRGTPDERKYLLKMNTLLDNLIDKSSMICAWQKHLEFAKQKKKVVTELCDKEMLNDTFRVIGESYQKIRDFKKANKWMSKSWKGHKLIHNLEGQALAKLSIGNVLDCCGDWSGALAAFEESYRIAIEANVRTVQLPALENMHYSKMIRFENAEEARRLLLQIDKLKQLKVTEVEKKDTARDRCSETDTEEGNCLSDSSLSKSCSKNTGEFFPGRPTSPPFLKEIEDDAPLISLLKSTKHLTRKTDKKAKKPQCSNNCIEVSPKSFAETATSHQTVGRKRVRVVLSDDEDETNEVVYSERKLYRPPVEDVATSHESRSKNIAACSSVEIQDLSTDESKYVTHSSNQVNVEDTDFPYKSSSPKQMALANQVLRSVSGSGINVGFESVTSGSICEFGASDKVPHELDEQTITFKIANELINFKAGSGLAFSGFSIESLSVEVACLYYLQLPAEERYKGLLPIIQHLHHCGKNLESLDELKSLNNNAGNILVEVSIDGWVQKRLMKLYINCCRELQEAPNINLLKKLYVSEVEDEVIASDCRLQDVSVAPLLNALQTHRTVSMLDLSHNFLGNGTMEKLQLFFTSDHKYGDLTLDLHCNRFGPTALYQICECPVFYSRLEVLNISGNRLTDACGSYLATVLGKCKALYSLNIERCSITYRTIQKIADAIHSSSILAQLSIGYNPVLGASVINLLKKLSTLDSFAELDVTGLKLNKLAVDSLCELAKTSYLTSLSIGSTGIGSEGAQQLTESLSSGSQESLKLDLSFCTLTPAYVQKFAADFSLACCILELNLEGNPILPESLNLAGNLQTGWTCIGIASEATGMLPENSGTKQMQAGSSCCSSIDPNTRRYLNDYIYTMSYCNFFSSSSFVPCQNHDPNTFTENNQLEELHVAENADLLEIDISASKSDQQTATNTSNSNEVDHGDRLLDCQVNMECGDFEVADSFHSTRVEAAAKINDTCTSSRGKNSTPSTKSRIMEELSDAIAAAKTLQLLDLSRNGLSVGDVEALYGSWSRLRKGSAQKHVKDELVHFSVGTNKCCRKPCCRRVL